MPNPMLTQLELPSGSTYDLVDAGARDLIAAINNWDYVISTNASNTPKGITWYDGSTLITGTLVASKSTMYKIYLVPSENGDDDVFDEYKDDMDTARDILISNYCRSCPVCSAQNFIWEERKTIDE